MPRLSVVIASYQSLATIRNCLRSLEQQTCQPDEVILVDSGCDGTAELVAREFPHVRLFAFAERKYPGDARNIALLHATGDVIAFLDADCVAESDWADHTRRAHLDAGPLIGGAVDNANPTSLVGWAAYFCEFSQWMPGGNVGHVDEIPTLCLSIKRWTFERYGPFLEGTYCSDTAFHWRARADGVRPLFHPSIRVLHFNIASLNRFVPKQVMHGRAFATVRLRERKPGALRIAIYAFGSPVLPLLLFLRITRRVLRGRSHVGRFIQVSPLVLIGLVAWSWGECRGYWAGLRNVPPVATRSCTVLPGEATERQ
ncbi:MAG TPA: glycosyltransferase [Bryobacteraceae bacterium]|nr:glycosyltransferase [Bryobacteraceae bacterium]